MMNKAEKYMTIYVIVNSHTGSKVLQLARNFGIPGGTILLGRGTIKNTLLDLLALNDTKKEIVLLVTEEEIGYKFLDSLNKELKLHKPNHGIAFTISVGAVCGSRSFNCSSFNIETREENTMYQAVYIIVDRGKGEAAVDAATKAGARGATIISARGSGIHETSKVFNMEIEPEKEIVLIVLKRDITEKVVSAIRDEFDIEKPGNGIMFVQDIKQVYGLFE